MDHFHAARIMLRARISKIQRGARIEADSFGRIGCCLIAESHFFRPADWVRAPNDWRQKTVSGAQYDLSHGEGLRIFTDCQARAAAAGSLHELPMAGEGPRFGAPALHTPRLGQGIFRVRVLDAYGRQCAVTREHSLPVLEAAHIRPYAQDGNHQLNNGIALRSDLHRLFDRGYVTFDENMKFVVGNRLKQDFENGRSYYALRGHDAYQPATARHRPSQDALAWHREHRFLG